MPYGRRESFKCIETGDIFSTKQAAATKLHINGSAVYDSLRDGNSHMGYTFVYVSELDTFTITSVDEIRPEGDWSPVSGFEGLYEISRDGRVWCIGRNITRSNGKIQHIRARLLTPSDDVHPTVALNKDKQTHSFLLSHLVATAYVPNLHNYNYVDHKDGDPKNNCADNLNWVEKCAYYSHPKRIHTHIDSRLSDTQLLEVQELLGEHYEDSGKWKLASIDSVLDYAICSSGKYMIQLSSKNSRNARISSKIIKFALSKDGYLTCSHGLLHRIVAEAFLDDWDSSLTVNHIDGNKLNNDISNLEMLSNAENVKHYFTSPVFEDSRNSRISSIRNTLSGKPGKPVSAETIEKRRQASLGRKCSIEQRQKMSQCRKQWWKIHGDSFRSNHPQNGKRYITKDNICKLVTAEEAESYVQMGWRYGMKPRGD